MLDPNYKDFRAYRLLDTGEKEEIEIEIEQVPELFNSEAVLLLVRYDMRKLFIWKGPKAPVRQRFISSRVGAQIQNEASRDGVHLKIISVDAGDEPIEFLKAFNCEPYEVSDDERPEDMYYLRNEERRKLEEEALAQKIKSKKEQKGGKEYWSPALEELEKGDQATEAKKKALEKLKSSAPPRTSPPVSRSLPARASYKGGVEELSEKRKKEILDEIIKRDVPQGTERINILIGTTLYGPQKVIAKVFGKEVEQIKWDQINEIPEGFIEIKADLMRAYVKDNKVLGIELLNRSSSKGGESKEGASSSSPSDSKKKRTLKEIPRG